jgi:uncharacterized YigZ family protein
MLAFRSRLIDHSNCRRHHASFRTSLHQAVATKTLDHGLHQSELEVKKSKFIAYASHVTSWEQAQACLCQVKQEHPKARHWCYGFKHDTNERCSDDGEPSGTAGLPILGAIQGEGLTSVVCIVVRYFGGIKLGAGGLIRSYGAAARQVLREAPVVVTTLKSSLQVTVSASYFGAVYEAASKSNASPSDESYGSDGSLTLTLICEQSSELFLRQSLQDATRGDTVITSVER